jgi:hypothetical protein
MKNIFFLLFIPFLFMISCQSNSNKKKQQINTKKEDSIEKEIEVVFQDQTNFDPIELKLLKELEICSPTQKDISNHTDPACHPSFFKFFKFNEKKSLKNSFLLLIKARVHDFPLRRILLFEREKGELVKVNGFVANLIGMNKSTSEHNDLILRFNENLGGGEVAFFNCRFVWRNNHYEFEEALQINDSNIKPEFKDSMNLEIEKTIMGNKMIF